MMVKILLSWNIIIKYSQIFFFIKHDKKTSRSWLAITDCYWIFPTYYQQNSNPFVPQDQGDATRVNTDLSKVEYLLSPLWPLSSLILLRCDCFSSTFNTSILDFNYENFNCSCRCVLFFRYSTLRKTPNTIRIVMAKTFITSFIEMFCWILLLLLLLVLQISILI